MPTEPLDERRLVSGRRFRAHGFGGGDLDGLADPGEDTDQQRPRFILTHAAATHRAIREGVPVKGFYFWSLVDNFEWAEGYSARFGLIEVEPKTQARQLKESARLYAEIAKANAITPQLVEKWAPEIMDQICS